MTLRAQGSGTLGSQNANAVAITGGSIGPAVTGVVSLLAKSFVPVVTPADVTEDVLVTINVAARLLGPNDGLRITTLWSFTNNANTKTMRVRYSGAAGTIISTATGQTIATPVKLVCEMGNRGATNSQFAESLLTNATAAATSTITAAVDTTVATTIVITGQKGLAGDALTLEGYIVEVLH